MICLKKMKGRICRNKDSSKYDIPGVFVSSIIVTVPQIIVDNNNTTVWTLKRGMQFMLPEIAPQREHNSLAIFSTCSIVTAVASFI